MGTEFTFYDFMEDGENLIHAWLEVQPKAVKAKFTNWLSHLGATPPGEWRRPLVETLTGSCKGLFEVRVKWSGMQYRLLGCHGPGDREPTLLHGFIKPDAKIDEAECSAALKRKETVHGDPDKHREIHDYS